MRQNPSNGKLMERMPTGPWATHHLRKENTSTRPQRTLSVSIQFCYVTCLRTCMTAKLFCNTWRLHTTWILRTLSSVRHEYENAIPLVCSNKQHSGRRRDTHASHLTVPGTVTQARCGATAGIEVAASWVWFRKGFGVLRRLCKQSSGQSDSMGMCLWPITSEALEDEMLERSSTVAGSTNVLSGNRSPLWHGPLCDKMYRCRGCRARKIHESDRPRFQQP